MVVISSNFIDIFFCNFAIPPVDKRGAYVVTLLISNCVLNKWEFDYG